LTKFGAAAWTGSSAMLSEGIHSVVDTGNEGLLLYGLRRAKIRPDREHPLGYGREIYFWSFVVALLVFAVGAGFSFYEGVAQIAHPTTYSEPCGQLRRTGFVDLVRGRDLVDRATQFQRRKAIFGSLRSDSR
jgi:divalent metal cation (Fe/Co/Zn/Cd) transporter